MSRMPTWCSSFSRMARCESPLEASSIISTMSEFRATSITCFPRPLPVAAPWMMPGRSISWIAAPLYVTLPGIAVSVVNSCAAASDSAEVSFVSSVDLPTEGKPITATRASPALDTSKSLSSVPPMPVLREPCTISVLNLASRALSRPRCCVLSGFLATQAWMSASVSLICSMSPMAGAAAGLGRLASLAVGARAGGLAGACGESQRPIYILTQPVPEQPQSP